MHVASRSPQPRRLLLRRARLGGGCLPAGAALPANREGRQSGSSGPLPGSTLPAANRPSCSPSSSDSSATAVLSRRLVRARRCHLAASAAGTACACWAARDAAAAPGMEPRRSRGDAGTAAACAAACCRAGSASGWPLVLRCRLPLPSTAVSTAVSTAAADVSSTSGGSGSGCTAAALLRRGLLLLATPPAPAAVALPKLGGQQRRRQGRNTQQGSSGGTPPRLQMSACFAARKRQSGSADKPLVPCSRPAGAPPHAPPARHQAPKPAAHRRMQPTPNEPAGSRPQPAP
jgi:hypothetical protein